MGILRDWMVYLSKHSNLEQHEEIRMMLKNYEMQSVISIFEKMFHISTFSVQEEVNEFTKNLKERGIDICTVFDEDYPVELKNIYDFPICLYLRGNRACLGFRNKISIIGSRKPTYDGMKMCDHFVKELAKVPFTIVSGLAFGIDLCSHQAALKYGAPAIAVLASGIDNITPRTNEAIGLKILEKGGLIISEYPPCTDVYKMNFVIRNRIISGLSMDLFVVEAGERSGSLTTARHALSQSRTIYAMPGSISNPVAHGTNDLIKQGATPITEALDFEPFRLWHQSTKKKRSKKESAQLSLDFQNMDSENILLKKIFESGQTTIEELSETFDGKDGDLMSRLMELEIMDQIEVNGDKIIYKKTDI